MKQLLTFIALAVAFFSAHAQSNVYSVDDVNYAVNNTNHTATVVGLSDAGKKKSEMGRLKIEGEIKVGETMYYVTKIADQAFYGMTTKVDSVVIGYGIETIGSKAFFGVSRVKTIKIPSSVTSIGSQAIVPSSCIVKFAGDTPPKFEANAIAELTPGTIRIVVPKYNSGTLDVYKNALKTSNINIFNAPVAGITYDYEFGGEGYCFRYLGRDGDIYRASLCYTSPDLRHLTPLDYLTPITYKYKIVEIGTNACTDSKYLKEVDLTKLSAFETIRERAFENCPIITDDLKLGNTIKTIEDFAFHNMPNLIQVNIPASVTKIGVGAFYGPYFARYIVDDNNRTFNDRDGILYSYDNTTLLSYPAARSGADLYENQLITWTFNLKAIAPYAFYRCNNLESISFPYGVKTIPANCIHSCINLKSCKIPSSVTSFSFPIYNCTSFETLYLNLKTPPSFPTGIKGLTPLKNLLVPRESVSLYKNATGWKTYQSCTGGAYDIKVFDFGNEPGYYTVTSSAKQTVHGEKYDGRAMLVAHAPNTTAGLTLTIPKEAKTVHNTYNFAVTNIGPEVFATSQPKGFTLALGENIDSISDQAFKDCSTLVQFNLNANLKYVGKQAFSNCGIANSLMFYYGIEYIGEEAFKSNFIQSIFIPATIKTLGKTAFDGLTKLKYLSINSKELYKVEPTLLNVPTTCKFYVPVGVVNQYKNATGWKKLRISAGACDFTYKNAGILNTRYHMTILSTDPVYLDGVVYDGTISYVYSPANDPGVLSTTVFDGGLYADYNLYGQSKKYLVTEYGDSCLAGATDIVSLPIEKSKGLSRIGRDAFRGTNITHVTLPNLGEIDSDAFSDCPNLVEVFMPKYVNTYRPQYIWGKRWFGNNKPGFACYIKWDQMATPMSYVEKWQPLEGDIYSGKYQINGFFIEQSTDSVVTFSVNQQVDWDETGITAYYLRAQEDNTLEATKIRCSPTGMGMLIKDFKSDSIYKLRRAPVADINLSDLTPNMAQSTNIAGSYYWDYSSLSFKRAPTNYILPPGRAYLKLNKVSGSPSEVFTSLYPKPAPLFEPGDVNGDGNVDVSDLNIIINIVLGNDSAEKYDGRAEVTGDGIVDVSDINAMLNTILGK